MEKRETKGKEVLGVDLWKLVLACLRRWPVILAVGLVFAAASYFYTMSFITPPC